MKDNSREGTVPGVPVALGFARLNTSLQKQPLRCFAGLRTSGGQQPIWGWGEPGLPLPCVLGLALYCCTSAANSAPTQRGSAGPCDGLRG